MAHFAKIDENNVVQQVIVVDNAYAPDESTGQAHLASCGFDGVWKQTSYNTYAGVHINLDDELHPPTGKPQYRGNYARIGYVYDAKLDAFIAPQPDPTWVLNTTTFQWEAPETSNK